MKFHFCFAALAAILSFASCKKEGGGLIGSDSGIKGKVSNLPPNAKVYLDEIMGKNVAILDTSDVSPEGSFRLSYDKKIEKLGRVRVGRANVILLLDGKPVDLTLDAESPMNYQIKGSPDNMSLYSLIKTIQENKVNPEYLTNFTDTVKNPLVGYLAIHYMNMEESLPQYEKFAARLQKEMPSSNLTAEFAQRVQETKKTMTVTTGSEAPDIKLNSPAGKSIALSDLRGKVVLVDFWASWCMPCRRENPNVVKMYEKYKSKGFEVFSVSLDRAKEPWVKAIETDKLTWPNHVSDLQGWGSGAAGAWGVRSIPATFLLDKEGKIIGRNLRGDALEKKLEELFANS